MKAALLGHKGMLGRHYKRLLHAHPWFTLTPVDSIEEAYGFPLVFTALPNHIAGPIEQQLAERGCKVISSAATHRTSSPIIIPEVNQESLKALDKTKGSIVTKPNCTVHTFVLPLTPLHRAFHITKLSITSMQALSGGGHRLLKEKPTTDRVSAYIPNEEQKCIDEPKMIWKAPSLLIEAACHRVPVSYGHVVSIQVSFTHRPIKEEILECWQSFAPLTLPSSPRPLFTYNEDDLPPLWENGMTIHLARLREATHFDFQFTALANNVIRGGSGAGVLIAELLHQEGHFV